MNSQRPKAVVSWSSGKDSAWTLHVLRQQGDYDVCGLLTTVNAEFQRVAMHGVRRTLLEQQARAAGLPLIVVELPWPCSNDVYQSTMARATTQLVERGIHAIAFGDLYLADVREYREKHLAGTGLKPIFPLWGTPTAELARSMLRNGLKAKLVCVDTKAISRDLCGRDFDDEFLRQLPEHIDPCAERGEFHTFCYDGPMFTQPIPVTCGEQVERDGFLFCDLIGLELKLDLPNDPAEAPGFQLGCGSWARSFQ